MGIAEIARKLEDTWVSVRLRRRKKRGFIPRVAVFPGYGSTRQVRVLGRVQLRESTPLAPGANSLANQRGWVSFTHTNIPDHPVRVKVGSLTIETNTDRGGYIDLMVENHGLEPGFHTAVITPLGGKSARANIQILGDDVEMGLISDIDDTVMVTMLPRIFLAAWNGLFKPLSRRRPVPGMARLYREILEKRPGMPVFYLSTGAWNAVPSLTEFFALHGFPQGPMLMTDWGPSNTGLFRSGREHKRTTLRDLLIMFPRINWILIGDDGQHDPLIFSDLAQDHPERVEFIAIRQLTATEQIFSHGTPEAIEYWRPGVESRIPKTKVTLVAAADGDQLARLLIPLIPPA